MGGLIFEKFNEPFTGGSPTRLREARQLGPYVAERGRVLNPLSPNSDQYPTSPYHITLWSNKHIMRMKEIITKVEIS